VPSLRVLALSAAPFLALGGCSAIAGIGDLPYPDAGAELNEEASVGDSAVSAQGDGSSGGLMDAPPPADRTGMLGSDGPVRPDGHPAEDSGRDAPAVGQDASSNAAFVQVNAASGTGTGMATLSVSVALPAPVAAHDSLIVAADFSTLAIPQIQDSLGNTFTVAVAPVYDGTAVSSAMWYVLDAAGGSETVTLTLASGTTSDFIELYAHEYSGLRALDKAAGATGTTMIMDSGAITTTSAGDLLFAFAETGGAGTGNGFTARSAANANLTEDEFLGAPGTYHATATMDVGTSWVIVAAAFKTH
jgi:hypothetical protein